MPEIVFEDAPEVREIAHRLITEHYKRLADAKIGYLIRTGAWTVNGDERPGNAEKCSGKHRHLTGFDFIVTVNHAIWGMMQPNEKGALVDHLLSHCGKSENGWCYWNHDVEDFASVVRRHGLWQEGVRKYAEAAVEASRQLTIYDVAEKKAG